MMDPKFMQEFNLSFQLLFFHPKCGVGHTAARMCGSPHPTHYLRQVRGPAVTDKAV